MWDHVQAGLLAHTCLEFEAPRQRIFSPYPFLRLVPSLNQVPQAALHLPHKPPLAPRAGPARPGRAVGSEVAAAGGARAGSEGGGPGCGAARSRWRSPREGRPCRSVCQPLRRRAGWAGGVGAGAAPGNANAAAELGVGAGGGPRSVWGAGRERCATRSRAGGAQQAGPAAVGAAGSGRRAG